MFSIYAERVVDRSGHCIRSNVGEVEEGELEGGEPTSRIPNAADGEDCPAGTNDLSRAVAVDELVEIGANCAGEVDLVADSEIAHHNCGSEGRVDNFIALREGEGCYGTHIGHG